MRPVVDDREKHEFGGKRRIPRSLTQPRSPRPKTRDRRREEARYEAREETRLHGIRAQRHQQHRPDRERRERASCPLARQDEREQEAEEHEARGKGAECVVVAQEAPERREPRERISLWRVRGLEDLPVPTAHVRGVETPHGGRQEGEEHEVAERRGRTRPGLREGSAAEGQKEDEEHESAPRDIRDARRISGEAVSPPYLEDPARRRENGRKRKDSGSRAAQQKSARRCSKTPPRFRRLLP